MRARSALALSRSSAWRGFTLVEVLVALVLMAVMSAMAWRGLDAMLRSRELTQQAIERSATLQTALAQWEQDLSQIVELGKQQQALAFNGQSLRLTRRHPQGLQVVAWRVADGQWTRWASPPVNTLAELRNAWQRSEQALTLSSQALSVMRGVQGWQLAYYWDNSWANALSSSGAPERPDGQSGLPKGVRMQLQLGEGSGFQGQLTRAIALVSGA